MEKQEWRMQKDLKREAFMTEEETKRINDYISELIDNRGNLSKFYARLESEETAYTQNQEKIPKKPNSRVNVFHAQIEGQVAAMVDQNIAVTTRGQSQGDEQFADWGRIGLDWTLRKNKIKTVLAICSRRFLKNGPVWMKTYFDSDALDGFGLAKLTPVALNKIFIDQKIKDFMRTQEADYISETILQSKTYAIETYGENKAEIIDYGKSDILGNDIFYDDEMTNDDTESWTEILRWSRHKKKLRLEIFSGCGVLLYDSHKTGERTDNQKENKYDHKSYYDHVNNKYPYHLAVCYPEEGTLYGFGDGKLMGPLQDMINDLYDMIRISAKPNLILIDTNSDIDVDDFDENSFTPRPFDGTQSQTPVHKVEWGNVNQAYWQLLAAIHQEIQRVTRFYGIMSGGNSNADSATEAAIQQQQGSSSTDHKKIIIQELLVECCEYLLGLMMGNYTEGKAFRVSDDDNSYEWIDFRDFTKAPMMKPPTSSYSKEYRERNKKAPSWEIVTENGKSVTKKVDLDIEINIGAGLPKNKTFLWQMIDKLSHIVLPDQNGMPRPGISWEEFRKFAADFLGLPLDDNDALKNSMPVQPPSQPGQPGQQPMQSANAPLGQGGNPQMSQLSTIRGGGVGG